jgi:hypothetical protein
MKRLILLALTTLSIAAGTMLSPATSLAADSTCSMHILKATSWSVQSDQFNDSWDFQCGGSNNESWDVGIYLQWRDSNATWHTFDCDNGNPCYAVRGPFAGGSERAGTNSWNVAGQLNCLTVRVHAVVVFLGSSPNVAYNSLTYQIGGC